MGGRADGGQKRGERADEGRMGGRVDGGQKRGEQADEGRMGGEWTDGRTSGQADKSGRGKDRANEWQSERMGCGLGFTGG